MYGWGGIVSYDCTRDNIMLKKMPLFLFSTTLFFLLIWMGIYGESAQRVYRVGLLIPESGPGESQTIKGFKDRLKDLGYTEGENLVVEIRDMKGDRSSLRTDANELATKKMDLILTTGTRATEAAKGDRKSTRLNSSHVSESR